MGEMRVLERVGDLFYKVEIEVMRDGVNRNNWDYRNVETYADTFMGCPILTAYVGNKIGDGHNMDEKTGPDGEKYFSTMSPYAERIVGCIGENEGDIRVEERNGQKWIVARGRLWRFYHKELVDKIARQGRMSVSAETEVFDGEKNGDVEVYTKWRGLGVTILGDDVQPAIPGANVKALSELRAAMTEMKLRAAALEERGEAEDEPEEPDGEPADEPDDADEDERDDDPEDAPEAEDVDEDGPDEKGKRGVIQSMNRKQLDELAKRFGEGCRVLAADDKHVCMLRNGEPCAYVFENADETIVPEHFQTLSVNAAFEFADETTLSVDIAEVTAVLAANCAAAEASRDAEKARADSAEAEVKRLREVEHDRRIADVKNALRARLNEIQAEMEVEGCEQVCEELEKCAEDYCGDCGNAEWTGAEAAVSALNAACMTKVLEKARQKKENERRTLAWDLTVANDNKSGEGLNGAIERILR